LATFAHFLSKCLAGQPRPAEDGPNRPEIPTT
jgi:hypothetical protein